MVWYSLTVSGCGSCLLGRWLNSVKILKCKFTNSTPEQCVWRRLQVHEQQSERQRKNVLQKVLIFDSRARELQCKDMFFKSKSMFFL